MSLPLPRSAEGALPSNGLPRHLVYELSPCLGTSRHTDGSSDFGASGATAGVLMMSQLPEDIMRKAAVRSVPLSPQQEYSLQASLPVSTQRCGAVTATAGALSSTHSASSAKDIAATAFSAITVAAGELWQATLLHLTGNMAAVPSSITAVAR